jgi:hypothetical protein
MLPTNVLVAVDMLADAKTYRLTTAVTDSQATTEHLAARSTPTIARPPKMLGRTAAEDDHEMSMELQELVYYCNVAATRQRGNLVGMGFVPAPGKKGGGRVRSGTFLFGLSFKGACTLNQHWKDIHID